MFRSIHVVANGKFSLYSEIVFHSIHVPCLLYLFLYELTLWLFQYLTIHNTSTNVTVHISFKILVSLDKYTEFGAAGSHNNSTFKFLRNFHMVFHIGCTNLYSYQQFIDKDSLFSVFSPILVACLFDNKKFWWVQGDTSLWFFTCNSLKINDVEHIFMEPLPYGCILWKNVCSYPLPIFF